MAKKVTVRVPATTSNLGPGYDCLGLALRIYNRVTVSRADGVRATPMVSAAAAKFFAVARREPFPFEVAIAGDVPVSRGLGSSVTVRLGTLMGLNRLAGSPLTKTQLFEICAELEGHPDNAAPAASGGFNVIAGRQRQRFTVGDAVRVVLLVPDFEVRTNDARRMLPRTVPHADAVMNAASVAQIVGAFASRRYAEMRGAFGDRLHQPFRKSLVPFFDDVVAAAESSGALGAFLSGSGSTIAALTIDAPRKIAAAMRKAAGKRSVETVITAAENRGAHIIAVER